MLPTPLRVSVPRVRVPPTEAKEGGLCLRVSPATRRPLVAALLALGQISVDA